MSNEYVCNYFYYCKICLVSGQLENELACVKFGLITDDTDIEELLEHVIKCGKEIEESSRVRFWGVKENSVSWTIVIIQYIVTFYL